LPNAAKQFTITSPYSTTFVVQDNRQWSPDLDLRLDMQSGRNYSNSTGGEFTANQTTTCDVTLKMKGGCVTGETPSKAKGASYDFSDQLINWSYANGSTPPALNECSFWSLGG
jgi:hypothetical protein